MPSYPTPPGFRMAYDRDGSVGFWHDGTTVTALTQAQLEELNDEDDVNVLTAISGSAYAGHVGVIFPELRDVVGVFGSASSSVNAASAEWTFNIQTSVDTTNGLDGTWVTRTATVNQQTASPAYRTVNVYALTGIKAVRLQHPLYGSGGAFNWWPRSLHIYGEASAGANPDRLLLWHPTLDQELTGADFDWGDLPQGDVTVKQFRVKNNSATKTAGGITVTTSTLESPNLYDLSTDGTTYAASISPANLAAGAISPILYVRRTSTGTTTLGLNAVRMHATPATMT